MEISSKEAIFPSTAKRPPAGLYTPANARRRVVFPAPLCPTSPILSPSEKEKVRLSMAQTLMPRASLAILPPVAALTKVFFKERLEEPKSG
jgi:hypothetical protein